ncbi:MAG: translocation/assembly module TamB domain-containing protein [Longimonas sp.]|uniref:translocation/assembly module TamB domain-containing protein n=1 Tax=Longimonas sp. TaxID=2039626 RepID=UPI00397586B3
MSRSPSSSWFGRVATGILTLCLLGLVVFFGLTRTEVGRDGLRLQLERQFNAQFEGSLHIERLDGNLINTLLARTVQVRDPNGRVVAQADSVVLRPTWQTLLNRTLTLRSVDVHTVHVLAEQTEHGMPLTQAFQRTGPPGDGAPLSFSIPHFRLHNAHVTTRHDGPPPAAIANGWMRDLLNTTFELPRAEMDVQWSEAERHVDVALRRLAHPASSLTVDALDARLERTEAGWALQPVTLSTPGSSMQISGRWSDTLSAEAPFELAIQADPIDFEEWGRLLPRLPNQDPVTIDAHVQGPLSDLTVETLQIQHNGATLSAEGTAVGFPNDIDVEGTLRAENMTRDVAAAWGARPLPAALGDVLPLSGEAYGRGQVRAAAQPERLTDWRPGSARGSIEVDLASDVGQVAANADLDWAAGDPLAYDGTLDTEELALGAFLPNTVPEPTVLTGRATLSGTGTDARTATANADIELAPSMVAGGPLQGVQSRLTLNEGTFSGTTTFVQTAMQQLTATWELNASDTTTLDATLDASALDTSPWMNRWQQTDFTGTLTAQATIGAGTLQAGTLNLTVDSSSVTPHPNAEMETEMDAESRSLPEHTITAQLSPPSDTTRGVPRLFVGGDVLSIIANGTGWTAPRLQLLPAWARAVASTIAYEHAADGIPTPDLGTAPSLQPASEVRAPSTPTWNPPAEADGAFSLESTMQLHRPEVLRAWLPQAPDTADSLAVQTEVYASPDSMHTSLHLTAATLHMGPVQTRDVDVQLDVGADSAGPLPERLRLRTESKADMFTAPAASLFEPTLHFAYEQRQGHLSFATAQRNNTGPIRLEADLRAFDLRNELIIQHISATAGPHEWRNAAPSTWRLYADRMTGMPLELTSDASLPNQEVEQSIIIDGRFSPDPEDKLNVALNNVQLLPLSQLAGWSQPLGGEVNGDLQVAGTWSTPIGTGNIDIAQLSFDRRLIGDLSATTRYIAGDPELEMALSITPSPDVEEPDDATRALVPDGIQHVVENRLDLGGRLRIAETAPGWDDDEWIDLTLDIERADLFFFDFIFADVLSDIEGATQGTGRITGRWSRPVFDADLTVDGAFSIPRFGLSYSLDGPVQVDRTGIHLQDAQLADGDDGTAEIGGSILFNDYQFFSFDLESNVDNLTIMDVPRANDLPFYGFIRASGPLELTGPLSNTTLTSNDARTSEDTEVFIPVVEEAGGSSSGFLIYADSTSQLFDWNELTQRSNIFSDRPAGEASFLDGMEIDLNVEATRGGRLHIVFDALVGDVITTEATGRVQLQREDGEFSIFGSMDVVGGTYLFTAGEVFVRQFSINEGTLSWDGDPINAELDIDAAFRTRASPAGLPGFSERSARIPVVIDLDITGRVETPEVALSLSLDRDQRDQRIGSQTFDALLNQDARMTEFATSVLLTNTFLLTTDNIAGNGSGPNEPGRLANTGGQLAFNSVSQLVSSQLNRYLSEALPNVDINVGVQGETADDLDIIYGVALRLLDERLIIRGEGVYTGNDEFRAQQSGPQGEFAVEVRLSNQVSMEVFYRRIGDDLTQGQTLTSTTGVGLFYQTQFRTWGTLWRRILGRDLPDASDEEADDETDSDS